jgi:exopolysaccharide biosynthesis polyprenyl glycosylphosphotransferase
MLKRFSTRYFFFSLLLDILGLVSSFLVAVMLRRALPLGTPYANVQVPVLLVCFSVVLWVGVAFSISLYEPKNVYKAIDEFQTLTLAQGLFWLCASGLLYFLFRRTPRLIVVYAAVSCFIFMVLWRIVMRAYFKKQNRSKPEFLLRSRVLVLGAGEVGHRVMKMISEYKWTGLEFVGFLDDNAAKRQQSDIILGGLSDVVDVVNREHIDDVILALPPRAHKRLNEVVSMLHELPVNVRIVPDYFHLVLHRATVEDFGGLPMISLRDPALSESQRLVKRIFDLMIGGAIIFFILPLLGIIALLIKLDSPGPVLFKQPRIGENGVLFGMLKFRSMVVGAEEMQIQINKVDENGDIIHKHKDDPRVTRVGRFLRRWSLDELPQFFNVLKGDMSIVGPRPELPWLVDKYEPWQRKRFAVPQGVTGWWQVNGRSDKMMHLHTDEDLYYIQHYSLWLDIFIVLKTPWVVMRGKGAF